MLTNSKMKTVYVIRTGTVTESADVSHKLRSRSRVRRAILAARRMGFKQAYAAKLSVAKETKILE